MSALPSARLELAAPERRPYETCREQRRLRLVAPTPAPLAGNGLPVHALDDWDRALDANESALDAAESMKVYDGGELLWHRQRLRDERRWLARVRDMGTYDPLPRLPAGS